MKSDLTQGEQNLFEYAKEAIIKHNKLRHSRGGVDTLYSFLLSERGHIYEGAAFEPNIQHATVCAERHAITNLVLNESYDSKIKSIIIADPVPNIQEKSTPPCGTCRHLIFTHGNPDTSVILVQYILGKKGWTFPVVEKFTAEYFYPYPYDPVEGLWEGFEPK